MYKCAREEFVDTDTDTDTDTVDLVKVRSNDIRGCKGDVSV